MAGTTLLGSVNLNDGATNEVRYIEVGAPVTRWEERRSLHGVNRQAQVRTGELREIKIGMTTRAASADALRTALNTIRAECAKVQNTLSLSHDGEASALSYALMRQGQPSVPWTELYELEHEADYEIVLTAEPFAYGSEVTLFSASAGTCPRVLDLSGMVGDYPAPLEITIAATVEDIASLYLGLVPDLSFDHYNEGEGLTWAGGSNSDVADAAAHGGYKERNTSSTPAIATYADTAGYECGTYLPLFRAKTSANSARIGWGYGGSEHDYLVLSDTFFKTYALKPVALPIVKTRPGTAANLQARIQQNVSGNADLDWVGLCPVSWGFASWVHPSSDATTLILGYDGTLYADGVASTEYKTGGPLYGYKTDRLCIFADDANGIEDALPCNVTIKYVPRYAQ